MSTQSFSIRSKLLVGFIAASSLFVISVLVTLAIISSTKNYADQVIKTDLPVYNQFIDLNSEIFMTHSATQSWLISHDEKYKAEANDAWNNIEKTETIINDATQYSTHTGFINTWQELRHMLADLKSAQLKVINSTDLTKATNIFLKDAVPTMTQISDRLNVIDVANTQSKGIIDVLSTNLNDGTQTILHDMTNLTLFEYSILCIGMIVSGVIALITSMKIIPPLNTAVEIAKRIAAGERKIKVVVTTQDETGELLKSLDIMQRSIRESEIKLVQSEKNTRDLFEKIVKSANLFSEHSSKVASGDLRQHLDIKNDKEDVMSQLGNDLNTMTENLSTIAKEITEACQNMVSTVEEVRHAVDSQSSGASEQASSVNEITASLSEIEKSSSQTMEKAKALGESAEKTREKGQQGLEAVDQSVNGMKAVRNKVQMIAQTILDLSNQTQQVGEITAVVNNLAQQSKMLALNASIEAAKAGEAGKGFSVVAVEVKNLAEQSELATTQVQKILEDIRRAAEKAVMVTEEGTKGVDEGTVLVEQTGEVIRNLNDVIRETSIASQQIESAVRQESAGIEQITAGMTEINQVTSSFVTSVTQTTEAIENLSLIAKNLKLHADTYKI